MPLALVVNMGGNIAVLMYGSHTPRRAAIFTVLSISHVKHKTVMKRGTTADGLILVIYSTFPELVAMTTLFK